MALYLAIGPLKIRSELEPVPRCEPDTYPLDAAMIVPTQISQPSRNLPSGVLYGKLGGRLFVSQARGLITIFTHTHTHTNTHYHWRRKRGGGGGQWYVCAPPPHPPLLTPHFYFPLELYVYITLTNNYLAFFIYQLIILWTISIH